MQKVDRASEACLLASFISIQAYRLFTLGFSRDSGIWPDPRQKDAMPIAAIPTLGGEDQA